MYTHISLVVIFNIINIWDMSWSISAQTHVLLYAGPAEFLRSHISTIVTLPSPIVTWVSDHSKWWELVLFFVENFEIFDLILMEYWPNIKVQIPSTEWDWWCLITVSLQPLQQWWSREELHTASPLPAPDQCLLKTTDNSMSFQQCH